LRILLVTWTDQLAAKLQILNPGLECCGIVVDEVEPAKKILEKIGLPNELLHPMYDLKECVKDFYYDYIICSENAWENKFLLEVQKYDVPKNKIVALNCLSYSDFWVERAFRYYKEHATEFEMFATGISLTEKGLDVTQFKRKLFNFGHSAQDLYYNFQTAKFALTCGGGIASFVTRLSGLRRILFTTIYLERSIIAF